MSSIKSKVRLPVSWDIATNAIEAVARDVRRGFEVVQRDNGYLELRAARGIALYVHIRVEGPRQTVVSVVARQTRRLLPLARGPRIDMVLNDFLAEVKRHSLDARLTA
jgi:hypothetical protein